MKNGLRRMLAALLLVCLLCSFVVPATFADGSTEETVAETYDFVLYDAENDKGYNSMFLNGGTTLTSRSYTQNCYCGCGKIRKHLDGAYENLGWKFLETSVGDANVAFRTESNWGLRVKATTEDGDYVGWSAYQIAVSAPGTYSLRYTSSTAATGKFEAFLFTAAELAATQNGTVAELMEGSTASAHSLGTISLSSSNKTGTFEAKNFTSAGDYIVVIKHINTLYAYIGMMELVVAESGSDITETTVPEETTDQETVKALYDFVLYNAENDKGYNSMFLKSGSTLTSRTYAQNCYCGCGKIVQVHLDGAYESLGWKYLESTVGTTNLNFRTESAWGLRVKSSDEEGWSAYQIAVPEEGTYSLRYTSSTAATGKFEAYVFTTAELAATQNGTVAELMADSTVSDHSLGTISLSSSNTVGTFAPWSFDPAGDYIVVIKHINTQFAYIGSLELVEGISVEEPTTPTTVTTPGDSSETTGGTTVTVPTECTGTYTANLYNFELYNEASRAHMFMKNGSFRDTDMSGKCPLCKKTLWNCIAEQYAENTLNWKLEHTTFASVDCLAAQGNTSYGLRFRYVFGEDGKVLTQTVDGTEKKVEQAGEWAAFRVKVDNAGSQRITVTKGYAGGYTAEVYIFPATAEAMTEEQLLAQMTEQNLAGQAKFSSTTSSSRVGEWNFEAAGEYIIVMKTAGSSTRLYLNSIELTEPVPDPDIPVTEKKIYNFDLSSDDPLLLNFGPNGRYNNNHDFRVRAQMLKLYKEGTTDWTQENFSASITEKEVSFRTGCFRFKNANNYRDIDNAWYAVRLRSPGTATYDIRLVNSSTSQIVINFYLIPVYDEMTLSQAQIEAAMTSENLLVSHALFEKKGTYYLGEFTFGTAPEYVLVFDLVKGNLLHLQEIQMTVDGLVADETISREKVINGTVYDFDLTDRMNGIFEDKTVYLADVYTQIEQMYDSGTLNWKWIGASDSLLSPTAEEPNKPSTNLRFYNTCGHRVYTGLESWTAYKIKSPGSGTFTLSLDHAIYSSMGTFAIYILPGDTEDIYKALDPSNRVGIAQMFGENTSVKDGFTTYVGYWDFEAGKEYIVVFEGYEKSPYSANCYLNVSHLNMERGEVSYTQEVQNPVTAITVLENPLSSADFVGRAVIKEIGGHDYYIMPAEAKNVLVYDLDTGKLVDSYDDAFSRPWGAYEDSEGMIWLGGGHKFLVKYDPYKQTWTQYNWTKDDLWHITGALDMVEIGNRIYFGAANSDRLVYFDKETEHFTEVGRVLGYGSNIRSMTYLNGYLYMGITYAGGIHVVKYDPTTETAVKYVNLKDMNGEDVQGTAKQIGRLNVIGNGDMIIPGTYGGASFARAFALDPETLELIEVDLPGSVAQCVTEIIDGKQYLIVAGYGLYQYDLETKTYSRVPGSPSGGVGFVSQKTLITKDGEQYLMTAVGSAGGAPRLYNLETFELTEWNNLVVDGKGGVRLTDMTLGEEGDNGIYLGGFNTPNSVVFDTEKGEVTAKFVTRGQAESSVWYQGKLYYANYSSTTLNEIYINWDDPLADDPETEIIQRWQLDHEETGQKRLHSTTAGDGYVFTGSLPDSNQWGGSITVYDTQTGKWYTHRNVVQDHAITGVRYGNELLWAASSFTPGTGTSVYVDQKENAQIIAYDYENREVIARLDPADYISGLATPILYIAGLGVDPVVEGRYWACVSATVFCFTFDRETLQFQVQEILSLDKTTYDKTASRHMQCRDFQFDAENGRLYYSLDSKGGLQCIELEDWNAPIGSLKVKSNKRLLSDDTVMYKLAYDGDLYYIKLNDTNLKMLPLNVTDEDYAISGAVDQMILDLGEITLEKEAAVKEARSAYENLKWRYKALSEELDTLQEAESDLLECKIDVAVQQEINADSYEPLKVLVEEYNAMASRYKNYVKNYDALLEAYNTASALNDQRLAEAMQKRMDALKEKFPLTLENEPEVVELRTDFDEMTTAQRVLVDATALEDAEAQIKVLRAEFVIYVEELIQRIPEEITLEAADIITEASEAADKLTVQERKSVSYSKLTSAESKLRNLQKAKAAADEVDALIKEIGIVTLGDKERIAEAREAYDKLNDTALSFLTKGKKLIRAEFILKALQTWGIPAITVANAGIVFAVLWFVPSLHSKVFKTKKKETEEIDN